MNRICSIACVLCICSGCAGSLAQETGKIFFPFYNRLYAYDTVEGTLSVLKETPYLFSRYFHPAGGGRTARTCYWLSGNLYEKPFEKHLFVWHPASGSLETVIEGNFMNMYPLKDGVVTVSGDYTPGKGYLFDFFRYDGCGKRLEKRYSAFLDILVSDAGSVPSRFMIAGYEAEGRDNLIIIIDTEAGSHRELFREKREDDFLKLVVTEKDLVFFPSSRDWEAGGEVSYRFFSLTSCAIEAGSETPEPVKKSLASGTGDVVLYGSGYYADGRLYVQVLDKDYSIGLFEIENYDTVPRHMSYRLPTGLYSPIQDTTEAEPGRLCFLGYNYYREKNRFYFLQCRRPLSRESVESAVCLPIGNE
ncbi:MAG: hypothetical protein JW881_18245 [Spirochaetales bacterium]|nr:hypothetical protein [Spirochaetales bacterium]